MCVTPFCSINAAWRAFRAESFSRSVQDLLENLRVGDERDLLGQTALEDALRVLLVRGGAPTRYIGMFESAHGLHHLPDALTRRTNSFAPQKRPGLPHTRWSSSPSSTSCAPFLWKAEAASGERADCQPPPVRTGTRRQAVRLY
jgi:hypothetical protein